jgi:hypothetical protein
LQDNPEHLPWIVLFLQSREYYGPDQGEEDNPIVFPSNNDFIPSSESPLTMIDEEDRDSDSSQAKSISFSLSRLSL